MCGLCLSCCQANRLSDRCYFTSCEFCKSRTAPGETSDAAVITTFLPIRAHLELPGRKITRGEKAVTEERRLFLPAG